VARAHHKLAAVGTRAVHFVGIDTSGSRVHELFPRWMDALGLDACVQSVDLPSNASRKEYRSLVESISTDGDVLGAVITSHKLGVFAARTDLFAEVDPFAALTHETDCLHKTARGLAAAAAIHSPCARC
jgi:shikimate dehydrogenase